MQNHQDLIRFAIEYARGSNDPSTQNSAFLLDENDEIITSTLAVNGFPHGIGESNFRWAKHNKYTYVEHAERNAIYNAARYGISTEGKTMIALWASCVDCARAIIQAGITTLIRYTHTGVSTWDGSLAIAEDLLHEAGVEIITITDAFVDINKPLLRHGEPWFPEGVRVS